MLVQTLAVHHPKDNMASVSLSSARTCPRRPQGVQPPLTVVIDNDVRPRTTSRKLSKPYLRYHARLAPPRVRVACADDVDWTVYDRRTRQMRTQRAKVQDIQGIRPRNRDELREKGVLLESGPCNAQVAEVDNCLFSIVMSRTAQRHASQSIVECNVAKKTIEGIAASQVSINHEREQSGSGFMPRVNVLLIKGRPS